ncbi:MAG: hypothetical protein K5852_02815 [Eubacterium sp.]|nr:hypothetical protein [Eubacterium sp.]
MKTSVYYMINAALYFDFDGSGILIDGVHEGQKKGFSPMPAATDRSLRQHADIFSNLRAALFTHLHPDHFDRDRLNYLLHFSATPAVYGPGLDCSNVHVRPLSEKVLDFTVDSIRILAVSNVHDGEEFREEPHHSFLLEHDHERFFVAGDAFLDPKADNAFLHSFSRPVTAAFVNLYQAASPAGKDYLRALQPDRIFLYHFPFPGDDKANYWRLGKQIARKWPDDLPVPELPEPMNWISDNRPFLRMSRIV